MRYILLACSLMLITFISTPLSSAAQVPQADPDKGLVVFYRLKSFKGGAIRFNVQHAEGVVGTLGSGTFLYKYFEPGQHQFWSQVISQDSISLTIEAGKIYYVKGEAQMGVYAGRPKFTLVSDTQGKADMNKL